MTLAPPDKHDPVALETATLALRRFNQAAFDAFLSALRAETALAIVRVLTAEQAEVMEARGAANSLRDILARMEEAEVRITNYEQRVKRNRNPAP